MGREADRGRLAGAVGPEAAAGRLVQAAWKRQSRAKKAAEKEALKALTPDEIKEKMALTEEDIAQMREILKNPGRNSIAQLGVIRTMLQYTVSQPKQEFGGDIGVQVIVNTMRRALPPVDVEPSDAESSE